MCKIMHVGADLIIFGADLIIFADSCGHLLFILGAF